MKTLILVRHAKSSWKNTDLTDRERPLNDRGKRDAPFMGKLLRERGEKPDVIISSPATRATTTARFIAREVKYHTSDIINSEPLYAGTMDDVLDVIHRIENSFTTAMIVSHNPAITLCSSLVTGSNIENMPTCGIVCVDFSLTEWKDVRRGNGKLRYLEYPKKYFK